MDERIAAVTNTFAMLDSEGGNLRAHSIQRVAGYELRCQVDIDIDHVLRIWHVLEDR